jgi:hypothetical protein
MHLDYFNKLIYSIKVSKYEQVCCIINRKNNVILLSNGLSKPTKAKFF